MYKGVVIFLLVFSFSDGYINVFDNDLYKDVLNEELCTRQLETLANTTLGITFLDVSAKLPIGVTFGNVNDLGDYFQCLGISEYVNGMHIEGKYSGITLPLDQEPVDIPDDFTFPPEFTDITLPPFVTMPIFEITSPDSETESYEDLAESFNISPERSRRKREVIENLRQKWQEFLYIQSSVRAIAGVGNAKNTQNQEQDINSRIFPIAITVNSGALLGVCIPKPCTATQAVNFFQTQIPYVNFTYNEYFYRLPNDKPFSPADYVAFVIFSLILCLNIASTGYDLYCTLMLKVSPNKTYTCFSVYTNTRRLLTFSSNPGALECVDGIRAISMLWVIVGHTYSMSLLGYLQNIVETLEWLRRFTSTWINSAPLTVDTFFLLSGILAVYTTIGKISKGRFIRTLHMFYINRLLRMFPLLATVILLQASVFNHVSDGPFWLNVAEATENCRTYWWSALLHVQNYVNPLKVCIPQSWYLSVDTQLYIACPIILVWMFGSSKMAWGVVTLFFLLSLVSSSVYSFLYNFPAALVKPDRIDEFARYLEVYYFNTLTRAPPFIIGMMYGYVLHMYRGKKVIISKAVVGIIWFMTFAVMAFCIFSIYPVMQADWDKQAFENFLNAYVRSFWAFAVGWVIFACVHGYGGPVNWFLSLALWKLPARISFAMYLIHVSIIIVANGSWTQTHYFSSGDNIYRFMSDVSLTFIFAFFLCVLIDAPFSTLQKLLTGGGKRPAKPKPEPRLTNGEVEKTSL